MNDLILSVSQVESFDASQPGGCARKWWFERIMGLRPDQSPAQADGDAGHALLARYLSTGEAPVGRVKMGKAVRGVIAKGRLPAPGADLLIERRFSGQPKRDINGAWIPVDVTATLWIGGLPWDGFIDLAHARDGVPMVLDHKFTSDLGNARDADQLIRTVQLPVYVRALQGFWPEAETWRIAHHYVCRTGTDSLIRSATVTRAEIDDRIGHIEGVVDRLRTAATATAQADVAFNRKSCTAWAGCPHQSICHAYQEKPVSIPLSPEEAAMFEDVEATMPPPAAPAPAPAPAAAPTPAKAHRLNIVDVPTPAPAPAEGPAVTCACGTVLTPENASRKQGGEWIHIGCKLNAPAAPPPPPAPKKAKAAPVEAPAAPATQASPVAPPAAPAPVVLPPLPPVLARLPVSPTPAPVAPREALATLFEQVAILIRAVG